jgi:two-component system sensor histidine kinase UhpB
MKLRTRLHLVVTGLTAVFVVLLVTTQMLATRARVREDIEGSHQVASQLLNRLVHLYWNFGGPQVVLSFLERLGHVRSNDIILHYAHGPIIYHSPPSTYKAGEYAPQWFTHLLAPRIPSYRLQLPGNLQLDVRAEVSRAILDGWDAITRLLALTVVLLILANGVAFWVIERALAPFPVIARGLERLEGGELHYRLPALGGLEAQAIGSAFNRMAQAVEDNVAAERKAREAEARLEERRELARLVEQRLEEERRLIAHELHDEFGQSVTAIRSLAQAIAVRSDEPTLQEAARLISQEAGRLYDAMHGLIPRLSPLTLDTLGLTVTLESLARDLQQRHGSVQLALQHRLRVNLGPSVTLAAYRFVQEGLINALRHAHATHIEARVRADRRRLYLRVSDDGRGLPQSWSRPGHFGLRGLRERIEHLGGRMRIAPGRRGGVSLAAVIPLEPQPEQA